MEKGRSWVLNGSCTKRDTGEVCQYCLAVGRQLRDLSNSGEDLWIFKVIACGSKVVASK